jgi:hypothetical protein
VKSHAEAAIADVPFGGGRHGGIGRRQPDPREIVNALRVSQPQPAVAEAISPELVLVDHELATRARAALPDPGQWAPATWGARGRAKSTETDRTDARPVRHTDAAVALRGFATEPWWALLPRDLRRAFVIVFLLLVLLAVVGEIAARDSGSPRLSEPAAASTTRPAIARDAGTPPPIPRLASPVPRLSRQQ